MRGRQSSQCNAQTAKSTTHAAESFCQISQGNGQSNRLRTTSNAQIRNSNKFILRITIRRAGECNCSAKFLFRAWRWRGAKHLRQKWPAQARHFDCQKLGRSCLARPSPSRQRPALHCCHPPRQQVTRRRPNRENQPLQLCWPLVRSPLQRHSTAVWRKRLQGG